MTAMQIGEFVRRTVPAIFQYCEEHDREELRRLQDAEFSKATFDVNYPFCKAAASIGTSDHVRFYINEYEVCGTIVRVTSQWFNPPTSRSLPLLRRYLFERKIPFENGPEQAADARLQPASRTVKDPVSRAARGRYKGNAIGNAQNYLVRNILSRLGNEQFGLGDWETVLADFGYSCAYCGAGGELVMDHVVPSTRRR